MSLLRSLQDYYSISYKKWRFSQGYAKVSNDRSLLELTERLVEEKGTLLIKRYRHHWQSHDGQVIKRWDNVPHHPEIDTFPHHLHNGSESNVIGHGEIIGLNALKIVISLIVSDNK